MKECLHEWIIFKTIEFFPRLVQRERERERVCVCDLKECIITFLKYLLAVEDNTSHIGPEKNLSFLVEADFMWKQKSFISNNIK